MNVEEYAQLLIEEADRLIFVSKFVIGFAIVFICIMVFVLLNYFGVIDWIKKLVKSLS